MTSTPITCINSIRQKLKMNFKAVFNDIIRARQNWSLNTSLGYKVNHLFKIMLLFYSFVVFLKCDDDKIQYIVNGHYYLCKKFEHCFDLRNLWKSSCQHKNILLFLFRFYLFSFLFCCYKCQQKKNVNKQFRIIASLLFTAWRTGDVEKQRTNSYPSVLCNLHHWVFAVR